MDDATPLLERLAAFARVMSYTSGQPSGQPGMPGQPGIEELADLEAGRILGAHVTTRRSPGASDRGELTSSTNAFEPPTGTLTVSLTVPLMVDGRAWGDLRAVRHPVPGMPTLDFTAAERAATDVLAVIVAAAIERAEHSARFDQVPDQRPDQMPDQRSEQRSEQVPGQRSEQVPDQRSEQVPAHLSGQLLAQRSDHSTELTGWPTALSTPAMPETALRDALTGLANHHALDDAAGQLLARVAAGSVQRVSAVSILVGTTPPQELPTVAALLMHHFSALPGSLVARVGDDEFAVLVTDHPVADVAAVADAFCASAAELPLPATVFCGLASTTGAQPWETATHLQQAAEQARDRARRESATISASA